MPQSRMPPCVEWHLFLRPTKSFGAVFHPTNHGALCIMILHLSALPFVSLVQNFFKCLQPLRYTVSNFAPSPSLVTENSTHTSTLQSDSASPRPPFTHFHSPIPSFRPPPLPSPPSDLSSTTTHRPLCLPPSTIAMPAVPSYLPPLPAMHTFDIPELPKRLPPTLDFEPPLKRHCPAKPEPYTTDLDPDFDPPSPASLPNNTIPPLPDKFTKSRAVGQSHRDNEKEHIEALQCDVQGLRDDNVLLFALFCAQSKATDHHDSPLHNIAQVLPWDRREDEGVLSDEQAIARGLYRLPAQAEHTLGQRYISLSLALIMLEFIANRRNLIVAAPDPGRRRRRRGSFRTAPTVNQANATCEYALKLFRNDAAREGTADKLGYVQAKFGALALMLRTWSEYEHSCNPPPFDPADEVFMHPPGSPTSPDAAEFGSPRRRGEGAKRCSRCNVIKVTGSGHGRSKCADGYSISSPVPYPASPPSEGNQSS